MTQPLNPDATRWPSDLLQPNRTIVGMSAILLPLQEDASIDWASWEQHVMRTVEAGLTPAVNMDTGFASLISPAQRQEVLRRTSQLLAGRPFIGGAYVADRQGATFQLDAYHHAIHEIQSCGGTPIIFPSYGLTGQSSSELIASFQAIGRIAKSFYAFELGSMFLPCGKVFEPETFVEMMRIDACRGIKHSSLCRAQEWHRLRLRNAIRPEFQILTGNDLAIDMVMYGSDYLLGLSTFAPDLFAKRDRMWRDGDAAFFELNDQLQYLGMLTFRPPVPAYRHSAAQFLKLRGWISSDRTFPGSPERPASDLAILREIAQRLGVLA